VNGCLYKIKGMPTNAKDLQYISPQLSSATATHLCNQCTDDYTTGTVTAVVY